MICEKLIFNWWKTVREDFSKLETNQDIVKMEHEF